MNEPVAAARKKTRGEILEGIGFTYCKVATVALICGKFTLPVAGALAAIFFVSGWISGKRDTRCFAGPPLFVAGIWTLVVAAWTYFYLNPEVADHLRKTLSFGLAH